MFSPDEGKFTGNLQGIVFILIVIVSDEDYIKETIFFLTLYEVKYQDMRY